MPAFTTIFAGISALAGLSGVSNAKKAQQRQAAANKKQQTTAQEAAALGAQGKDQAGADIALGTSKASDVLLKDDSTAVVKRETSGQRAGGLRGRTTNIGGL